MKKLKYVAAAMLAVMLFAGQALANGAPQPSWDITDIYDTDLNTIEEILNPEQGVTVISEDYNETLLVPYPSHDGFGIVNGQGQYFDKLFVATQDMNPLGEVIVLDIYNSTGYEWSDYHIEFWDGDFQNRLLSFPIMDVSNDTFDGVDFNNGILSFSSPGLVPHGEYLEIELMILPGFLAESSFGMRQVATTTPEPISSILFVTGGTLIACRRFFFPKEDD